MTGIVNSTGARSGIIGTTVGTPSGGSTFSSLTLTPGATPGSPSEGEMYYNTSTNVISI